MVKVFDNPFFDATVNEFTGLLAPEAILLWTQCIAPATIATCLLLFLPPIPYICKFLANCQTNTNARSLLYIPSQTTELLSNPHSQRRTNENWKKVRQSAVVFLQVYVSSSSGLPRTPERAFYKWYVMTDWVWWSGNFIIWLEFLPDSKRDWFWWMFWRFWSRPTRTTAKWFAGSPRMT